MPDPQSQAQYQQDQFSKYLANIANGGQAGPGFSPMPTMTGSPSGNPHTNPYTTLNFGGGGTGMYDPSQMYANNVTVGGGGTQAPVSSQSQGATPDDYEFLNSYGFNNPSEWNQMSGGLWY